MTSKKHEDEQHKNETGSKQADEARKKEETQRQAQQQQPADAKRDSTRQPTDDPLASPPFDVHAPNPPSTSEK